MTLLPTQPQHVCDIKGVLTNNPENAQQSQHKRRPLINSMSVRFVPVICRDGVVEEVCTPVAA